MNIKSSSMNKLADAFYRQDAVSLAIALLGKIIVVVNEQGGVARYRITETEAYVGEADEACHAHKGRTPRTEIMYSEGGCLYVYLIYGMYWMLNVVAGDLGSPEAVLIRGVEDLKGPGKVGRKLGINKSYYGEDLITSTRIWIEDSTEELTYISDKRVGIDYAGVEWRNKPWRFIVR